MSVNGARNTSSGIVAKIVNAEPRPPSRLPTSDPTPCARKLDRVVSVATE